MPIKESSDELNPAVAIPARGISSRASRTLGDYVALAIATCGVGYFPIAPGTLGALVGIAVFLPVYWTVWKVFPGLPLSEKNLSHPDRLIAAIHNSAGNRISALLILVTVVSLVGVWAASRAEKISQKKDPSIVVIDEVAGQMIALLSVVWFPIWWSVLSAFLLFRLFDIWKPYPVRRLEALESGLGIMADDVLAGVYALIVNSVLISLFLFSTTAR